MESILIDLGFFKEDIANVMKLYTNEVKFIRVIAILKEYKCNIDFIKWIIINKKEIFEMDIDRLEYILDAISSNNDIIEETLLDII